MKKWLSQLSLLLYLLIGMSSLGAYQYKLSIAMIFQNDAPYLKEWIEFHRLLGVDHFYLFNNLSDDNYREVLKPYMRKGIVELFEWPYASNDVAEWDKIQVSAYDFAWRYATGKTKWLAILDSDEFLFPTQSNSLPSFLKEYEKYGGLCVNWVMYGTSNVSKVPEDKLLIESLVLSSGGSDHFKSIFRPERVAWIPSPHYVCYKEGYCHVTPDHGPVHPPFIQIEKIRINHYWSRDEFYLNNVKIPRRAKWGTPPEVCLTWANNNNACYDPAILRFVEPLKRKMFGR